MSNKNEVLRSAKDIVINMEDLVNDIDSLDEHEHDENECNDCQTVYESGQENHEHDADECRDCQTIREEADENHDHDAWRCTGCESMLDETVSEKIGELDVNDLMDQNYDLWQTVGEEAVSEYQERTGSMITAITELAHLVNGLYDTLETTDDDDVLAAITFLIEKVYGVREEPKPDIIEEIVAEAPSVTTKCSCGADHSIANYTSAAEYYTPKED